jgi:hypothetical protein
MSYATAARHEPGELVFLGADDLLNVVHFQAASASRAHGPWNTVALDVITGEIHCSCLGFQTGRECWHLTLVQAAWDAHPARVLASQYNDDQLLQAGTKAARMCRVYRRRTWRVLPDDQVALVACRQEYRARQARATADPDAARIPRLLRLVDRCLGHLTADLDGSVMAQVAGTREGVWS